MKKRILIAAAALLLVVASVFALMLLKDKKAVSDEKRSKAESEVNLVSQAKSAEEKNDLLAAKAIYLKLISDFPNSSSVMNWEKKSENINIKLLFSPVPTPKSAFYEIKPGDTLTKIAGEYKTTTDLIMKSNNLSSDKIVPGRKIKVWNAPFNIFVDKSQNILILKTGEEIIKTYSVSTGKNNCTPVGTFKIVNKLKNPTWFKAGAVVSANSPENILGTRWLGFNLAGYGIHGTTEPEALGKQVTQGCVRMANPDVEEIYTIVPVGAEVTVVD